MGAVVIFLAVIAGLIIIFVGMMISLYNKLVTLRNTAESSFSDIDVQLKKRYDLIPNLVETVKGYASHEKGIFDKFAEARDMAGKAQTVGEKAQAENMFRDTLKSLFAVSEAYPELKANENFINLQNELTTLEGSIESARRYYNAVVRDLNTQTDVFPSNIVAGMFHIGKKEYFELEAPAEERKAPKVSFQ